MYKPHTTSNQRHHVDQVELDRPIYFWMAPFTFLYSQDIDSSGEELDLLSSYHLEISIYHRYTYPLWAPLYLLFEERFAEFIRLHPIKFITRVAVVTSGAILGPQAHIFVACNEERLIRSLPLYVRCDGISHFLGEGEWKESDQDAHVWRPGTGENRKRWTCIACDDGRWHVGFNARKHEHSHSHKLALSHWQQRLNSAQPPNPLQSNSRATALVHEPLMDLLGELHHRSPSPLHAYHDDSDINMGEFNAASHSSPLGPGETSQYTITMEDTDVSQLQPSVVDLGIGRLAEELERYFLDNEDNEDSESSDDEPEEDFLNFGQRRTRSSAADPNWFPWADKALRL
ncbi:hypothetical protein EV361DRAFT_979244, partial [Lentinula raphanica]